jgi:hypothetical protein
MDQYHQQYTDQTDIEISRKVKEKEDELNIILKQFPHKTDIQAFRIAVMGCGDKRFVSLHKNIFEKVLQKPVRITTFDITVKHLQGEENIAQHDCTKPFPNPPYNLTYAHVLLKFIPPEKQWDIIINSYYALAKGGIAIHILDNEEIKSGEKLLKNGLYGVNLNFLEDKLKKEKINYQEIALKYGKALILLKS